MERKDSRILGDALRKLKLTEKQLELCYGGMLGDSSITPRPNGAGRLRLSHGSKQKEYLEWKASLMRPFIIQENPTSWNNPEKNINGTICPPSTAFCYETVVHQTFTDLYGLFYEKIKGVKRKRLTMSILNKVTPFSVLIWFLDDGSYFYSATKNTHSMYLSTYRYTLGEHQTLKKWFWHKWRIESVISYDKTHNKYILRFNVKAQKRFYELFLKPFSVEIPKCMAYKIPNFKP